MAKVFGGIFGRLSGKVGNNTFGAARTRAGKAVTVREKVTPSNPNTPAQVVQRGKFKSNLWATRRLSATLWQEDFNRAIEQLPGFQSMMSILLNSTTALNVLTVPPDTPLGSLHRPASVLYTTGTGGAGEIDINWTTELGINGTDNDLLVAFAMKESAEVDGTRKAQAFVTATTRVTGTHTITCEDPTVSYIIGAYFRGAGTADGLLSPCDYGDAVSDT